MADVDRVEVVVSHHDCATLRVGDVFLKIDADQTRTDVEVEAMALAPIPTPQVLWRKPPVLALAAVPGTVLAPPRRAVDRVGGRVGRGLALSSGGCTTRRCRPLPAPRPGTSGRRKPTSTSYQLMIANAVLPADLVARNRRIAEAALGSLTPVFAHGDLHIAPTCSSTATRSPA